MLANPVKPIRREESMSQWAKTAQPNRVELQESPPKPMTQSRSPVLRLDQLVLNTSVRQAVNQLVNRVRYHEIIFEQLGMKRVDPNGGCQAILFYGPAGTGKTSLAEALAHELNRGLLETSLAHVESAYPGEAAKCIDTAFQHAQSEQAVLFFDEASTLIGQRSTGGQAADRNHHLTQSVLLKCLERHRGPVVFATNFLNQLEPAFQRRILLHVEVALPDETSRLQLWQAFCPCEINGRDGVNFSQLAAMSEGLSGGDIKNAMWLALTDAVARNPHRVILQELDINHAIQKLRATKNTYDYTAHTS